MDCPEQASDEFSTGIVVWKGMVLPSVEHARWAALFDHLRQPYKYRPRTESFEKPVFSYYKRKTEQHFYEPPFFLEWQRVYVEISNGSPTSATLERCGMLAERTGRSVAVFRGPMYVPDLGREPHSVPITMVMGEGDVRREPRYLLDDGWKLRISRMHMAHEAVTNRLQRGFRKALMVTRQLRQTVRFAQVTSPANLGS